MSRDEKDLTLVVILI